MMERRKGYYALLQYSPVPERQEFVNVGVLLCVPDIGFLQVKFAESQRRIERVFGQQDRNFIQRQQRSLETRLRVELSRYLDVDALEKFARLRANELRITPLRPASVGSPEEYLDALFHELVSDEPSKKRAEKLQSKLRGAFKDAGVIDFLSKPKPVEIKEFDMKISTPFAYQNGYYNMIDSMRLDKDPEDALEEAGKRALKGRWLAKADSSKRLVVVGDFSNHPDSFFKAVSDEMISHDVKLYKFENLCPLIDDIKKSIREHGSGGSVRPR